MIPSNLRVLKYLSGSAEIVWDGVLGANEIFEIHALNYTTSVWDELSQTRYVSAIVTGPYSAIKIALLRDGAIVAFSETLPISISNASNIHVAVVTGQDESGQARFLATTPEGVLKVTGATITNTGGDASAVNQLSQISQLNTLSANLSTTITALNNILAKLTSVGLDNTSVLALKSVSVTNLPSNFPDFAVLAAVNNLGNIVAKAQNISDLIAATNLQLKTSDISLDENKNLNASIKNLPGDYPDSVAQLILSSTLTKIEAINDNLSAIYGVLSQVNSVSELTHTALSHIEDFVNTNSQNLINIFNRLAELLNATNGLRASNDAIKLDSTTIVGNTTGLLKQANLSIDADKDLGVKVKNLPGDYPDSAAMSELAQIKNNLLLINQGVTANISGPIPAGQNLIGSVNINALPLPGNAALETTQSDIKAINNSQLTIQAFIKDGIDYLNTKASAIEDKLPNALRLRTKILDEFVELSSTTSIRLLDYYSDTQPEELNNFTHYEIILLSYAAAFDANVQYESAYHGQSFYHTIKSASLGLASISDNVLTMPLQNISIKFTKMIPGQVSSADVARVIIYGRG